MHKVVFTILEPLLFTGESDNARIYRAENAHTECCGMGHGLSWLFPRYR